MRLPVADDCLCRRHPRLVLCLRTVTVIMQALMLFVCGHCFCTALFFTNCCPFISAYTLTLYASHWQSCARARAHFNTERDEKPIMRNLS